MMRPSDYAELQIFAAIAQERSFRRAAARLRLTPSTLSHSLRALEERLGVQLVNRTTRTVAATRAGAALLAEVAPALQALEAAQGTLNGFRARPQGSVRLTVPRAAATMLLAPRFAAFNQRCPDVTLEVTVDDRFVDILRDGFDAGIRLGESVERDMVSVRLTGELRGVVVASPAYLGRHPAPRTPRDLAAHRCINRRLVGSGALFRWEFAREGERLNVLVDGPLVLNVDDLMLAAALDGVGLAMLSGADVRPHLEAGRLVEVLRDWAPLFSGFFLYHPRGRQPAAPLQALIETLVMPLA